MLIANLLNIQFYYLRKLKDSRIGKCIALPFTVTDFDSVFFFCYFIFVNRLFIWKSKNRSFFYYCPQSSISLIECGEKKINSFRFFSSVFCAILQFLFFNFSLNVGRNSSIQDGQLDSILPQPFFIKSFDISALPPCCEASRIDYFRNLSCRPPFESKFSDFEQQL